MKQHPARHERDRHLAQFSGLERTESSLMEFYIDLDWAKAQYPNRLEWREDSGVE